MALDNIDNLHSRTHDKGFWFVAYCALAIAIVGFAFSVFDHVTNKEKIVTRTLIGGYISGVGTVYEVDGDSVTAVITSEDLRLPDTDNQPANPAIRVHYDTGDLTTSQLLERFEHDQEAVRSNTLSKVKGEFEAGSLDEALPPFAGTNQFGLLPSVAVGALSIIFPALFILFSVINGVVAQSNPKHLLSANLIAILYSAIPVYGWEFLIFIEPLPAFTPIGGG